MKKANGQWQLCVDFIDLNSTCPKDSFPFPIIDQLINATANHKFLRFMDTYLNYNQIKMYELDYEKTAFIMDRGYMLSSHAFRAKKCRCHLLKIGELDVCSTNRQEDESLS